MQISSIHFNFNKKATGQNNLNAKNRSFTTAPVAADTVSFGDRIQEIRDGRIVATKKRKQARDKANQARYQTQLEKHPSTAFLYNPDLLKSERAKMATTQPTLKTYAQFAKEMGVMEEFIKLCAKTNLIEVDHLNTTYDGYLHIIDTEFGKNKEFIDYLKEKMPSSVSGGKFQFDYNINDLEMKKYLETQEAITIGPAYETGFGVCNMLLDKLDPINQALITKLRRQRPIPSEKYYKKNSHFYSSLPQLVPAKYLASIGFGDSRTLTQMVVSGKLPGTVKKEEKDGKTFYSAKVDVSSFAKSEKVLKDLRRTNPDIIKLQDLAKQVGIRPADVKYFMQKGDIDIIPEYIFWDDYNSVFINQKDPKNSVFIEELQLRKQLEEEVQREADAAHTEELQAKKQQNDSESSLRMKIAWHLCPYTREILKSAAQDNKHLGLIIAKEENKEELTPYEELTLNSYRKRVWETGHAKEAFSDALNQAITVMKQLKTEGIDSISDPEIVKIINDHNSLSNEED